MLKNESGTAPQLQEAEELKCSVPYEPWIDLDIVLDRCGGDQDLLLELATMFPTEASNSLAALRQAHERGDFAGVRLNAHTLKGMCRAFELQETAESAAALEETARRENPLTPAQLQEFDSVLHQAIATVESLRMELGRLPSAATAQP
jgi:HPt (histidine-containing phosphotransfer) domain-containing protein